MPLDVMDEAAVKQVADSFNNVIAGLGLGANNLQSNAQYSFSYWSRNRAMLEAMYRGSWIVSKVVDIIPDDMCRAGIDITWSKNKDAPTKIRKVFRRRRIWQRLNSALKWSRLYGGSLAVIMIDGQDVQTPLSIDKIGKGSFRGLHVLDRWMVTPSSDTIQEIGPSFGHPESYLVMSGQGVPFAGKRLHHSRVLRFEGQELPYFQKQAEQGWGLSVIEPLYDRMVAYDTATAGTANLVHKAHLRTIKIKGLRQIIAQGGAVFSAVIQNIKLIRLLQSNEGITLLDGDDEFEVNNYTFSGLSDVIMQFGSQLCGAAKIPATRMFGDSPSGMNATGESDMRNFYDDVMQESEDKLREPIDTTIRVVAMSEGLGEMPDDADFTFNPLWQLSDTEKANIAESNTGTILKGHESGLISDQTALREMQGSGRVTGVWSTITDDDVAAAEAEPPDPAEVMANAAQLAAQSSAIKVPKPNDDSEQPGAE